MENQWEVVVLVGIGHLHNRYIHLLVFYKYYWLELGGTEIFKAVQYFIKYHGINNYCGI